MTGPGREHVRIVLETSPLPTSSLAFRTTLMTILRRIDPVSLAKVFGLLYALIGLLVGALISLLVVAGTLVRDSSSANGAVGFLFGAGAIVILPLFYGALGLVGGLLTAIFYNLAAKLVGGVVLELEPKPSA
mgnify:CR=1 FL=1